LRWEQWSTLTFPWIQQPHPFAAQTYVNPPRQPIAPIVKTKTNNTPRCHTVKRIRTFSCSEVHAFPGSGNWRSSTFPSWSSGDISPATARPRMMGIRKMNFMLVSKVVKIFECSGLKQSGSLCFKSCQSEAPNSLILINR
jgi:hypothetical protein